jgi:hypothetical protein
MFNNGFGIMQCLINGKFVSSVKLTMDSIPLEINLPLFHILRHMFKPKKDFIFLSGSRNSKKFG